MPESGLWPNVGKLRRGNHLLATLPDETWMRWLPHLEEVRMSLGQVVCESDGELTHLYFPITSIVSLLNVMADGSAAETAVVGNDGVVGISKLLSGGSTPSRGVVTSTGVGLRLKAQLMNIEFRSTPVLDHLLRYMQALITQTAQTAVCNRFHSLDRQLCRFLLSRMDRLQGEELMMTQELIANMLGVRRAGVAVAAAKLQTAGLIRYVRGHIFVVDRAGLERRSCECYALVRREYERMLSAEVGHKKCGNVR